MKSTQLYLFAILTMAAAASQARPPGGPLDRLDPDGDGLISQDEFQSRNRDMFSRLDGNDDGVITRDEMQARQAEMAARHAEMQARASERFEHADADGDGMVTRNEAETAAFNRLDTDGDGYLSGEELTKNRPHRPGHGRQGPGGRTM